MIISIFLLIIFIIFVIFIYSQYSNSNKDKPDYSNSNLYIDINEARNSDFNMYIDVRTNFEYRTNGFYGKAINIPLSN